MHTLLYFKWVTIWTYCIAQGHVLNVAAWMGGEFGGEWTRAFVQLSLCCPAETIKQYYLATLKYKIKVENVKHNFH